MSVEKSWTLPGNCPEIARIFQPRSRRMDGGNVTCDSVEIPADGRRKSAGKSADSKSLF
jgi:hypothetical protein